MKKESAHRTCPGCKAKLPRERSGQEGPYNYCPQCGASLTLTGGDSRSPSGASEYTLGIPPTAEEIAFSMGPYQVLKTIGKGGMGEVFLAFDSTCGRRVALKKIRDDLKEYQRLQYRFLKEARITSQLTHPAIIPIYSIHAEKDSVYYTMPYVEGETLKDILRRTFQQEKAGEKPDFSGSIPSLMRIYLAVCQAVAYAHSHGVVHRDLKPENIIVGKYGEVLILDWGLAQKIREKGVEPEELPPTPSAETTDDLTATGRIVGTVNFMAPERALGHPASARTDIYSLGVVLYQILTLRLPFHRESIEKFKETYQSEEFTNPVEVAPYRDVPRILSRIVRKCLASGVEDRYVTVDELIYDLEHFTEGRSEWFQVAELDPQRKEDWEFQEHVFLAEHVAVTQHTDVADWVHLMISKASFAGNLLLETEIYLEGESQGIGFLFNVPEQFERKHPHDGYCLWLGSDLNKSTQLSASAVEVMDAPEVFLERNRWYRLRIERVGSKIVVYLNNQLQFSYISYLPMAGMHVGVLSRDAEYQLRHFTVSVSSLSLKINCLAVPDAFLAAGDYERALGEYRRIAESFPGRAEGREALFRAGIVLLDRARQAKGKGKLKWYDRALEEFEKLRHTPGGPLEYLGKALVYQTQEEFEEELKCYELAYRRYRKHPLLDMLREQIVYRMHDSARRNRLAAYHFILLALRHLKQASRTSHSLRLFDRLQRHWEPLPFMETDPHWEKSLPLRHHQLALGLAFWIGKPYSLIEGLHTLLGREKLYPTTIANGLFALLEMGSWRLVKKEIEEIIAEFEGDERASLEDHFHWLNLAVQCHEKPVDQAIATIIAELPPKPSTKETRTLLYAFEQAIRQQAFSEIIKGCDEAGKQSEFSEEDKQRLEIKRVWSHLMLGEWEKAGERLHIYPMELLGQESSLLHTLYGCWLSVSEGREIARIHFAGVLETTYPRSWTLLGHYLSDDFKEDSRWFRQAFMWEKRQLYQQLNLYYTCSGDKKQAKHYRQLGEEQYVDVAE